MNADGFSRFMYGTCNALLVACLCIALQTAHAVLVFRESINAKPASSEKLVNLLGIYESVPVSNTIPGLPKTTPENLNALPLTAAATFQKKSMLGSDPKDLCQVLGPFRLMARPDIRFEILRDPPNKLVILFENASWGYLRTIRIGAEHIQDFSRIRPMWNGDSTAKWERDTLVIDSIHFTNKTWLNELGVTNSKQLHLVERLRLVDGGKYLEYRATAIDPGVLAQPASYTRYFRRSVDEISEFNCYSHKPLH